MYIWKRILKNRAVVFSGLIFLIFILAGILAPWIAPHDPLEQNLMMKYAGPSKEYIFGNDYLGRCIFSRILYAIRPSFLLIIGVLAITALIGAAIGITAGYFGGKTDNILMRICDIILTVPSEVLTLAFVGLMGVGLKNIMLAYIMLKWASYARLIRTNVLKYRNSNYVMFAKAAGNSNLHIILHHIIPSILSEMIVVTTSSISAMILTVSGMSFLGLGIQPPTPEWGAMLYEAKEVLFVFPMQMMYPGLMIVIISLASVFLSDGLRDVLDPQYFDRR